MRASRLPIRPVVLAAVFARAAFLNEVRSRIAFDQPLSIVLQRHDGEGLSLHQRHSRNRLDLEWRVKRRQYGASVVAWAVLFAGGFVPGGHPGIFSKLRFVCQSRLMA